MNYLAHLLLSESSDDSRLGGMIGDFMRGHRLEDFAPGVRAGIERHRLVDRLTDADPVFRRSRARLTPAVGRFAGVVVDVAFDHFLARDFGDWHDEPLAEFTAACYRLLERRQDELPERLRGALRWIVGRDWLTSYAETAHIERALGGIAGRVKRAGAMDGAFAAFAAHYDALAADFAEFFPRLRGQLSAGASGSAASEPAS